MTHPAFQQPRDTSVLAWRYMELPKLLSLIVTRQLYLRRLDLMPDKYEGLFPARVAESLARAVLAAGGVTAEQAKEIADHHVAFAKTSRKMMFVSCWHLSHTESEAMWRIYCRDGDGAAIVLPYAKLSASINTSETNAYLGLVNYLDYDTAVLGPGNAFIPTLHKREQFRYEQEARIVKIWVDPTATAPDQEPPAISIPWDVGVAERIVVSPYAPDWYVETVRAVINKLDPRLGAKVGHSPMAQEPS
jgi:hypothetical protein